MGQPALFVCHRCDRSYDKAAAFKRHGYYCRTRDPVHRATRRRACLACVRAKTKCSSTFPSCLSCDDKGLVCHYDGAIAGHMTAHDQLSSLLDPTPLPPSEDEWTRLLSLDNLAERTICAACEVGSAVANTPLFDCLSPASLDMTVDSSLAMLATDDLSAFASIPGTLISPQPLVQRRPRNAAARTNARLLQNILLSFPRMLQRRETLPPFIHHSMLSNDESPKHGPSSSDGPLAQCVNLARIWTPSPTPTTAFVWRSVRRQLETWWSEDSSYTNTQLLACQQALLIFTLMRIAESTHTPHPIDEPLLKTLSIVSKTLMERVGNSEFIYGTLHEARTWEEWILHESRRRIACVARLINLLVDIDSTVNCYLLAGYVLAPLPSSSALWEAKDTKAWEKEFGATNTGTTVYALGIDGRLRTLKRGENGEVHSRELAWEDYLSVECRFGMAVMIAGSIVEANNLSVTINSGMDLAS